MRVSKKQFKLYAVTDSGMLKNGKTLPEAVEEAVKGGATIIQLREKNKSRDEIIEMARELKLICRKSNVPLIINDSVEIAYKSGADGVHLGLDDGDLIYARRVLGENAIIGATAHDFNEARTAWAAGADYLGCGAVFGSNTKHDTVPLPIHELKRICNGIEIPVVAIGGINAENIMKLKNTGIAGAAVVSAVFAQEDIHIAAALLNGIIGNVI